MAETNWYADQVDIETPEQVDLRFPVAGVGSRFVAVLVDQLVIVLAYLLIFVVLYKVFGGSTSQATDTHFTTAEKWVTALFILLNFLLVWGYFVLLEAFWNGQTLGKRVMKVRVLKDSGRSITLFEAMARNLLRPIDSLPGFYLVGLISMVATRQNKRLGDLVAGTIVVHERGNEQPMLTYANQEEAQGYTPQARAARAASEEAMPADAVARLRADDLHVIETFFARALDLSVATRESLAKRLAETMAAKMGIVTPAGMEPERMLELVAYRMRGQGLR